MARQSNRETEYTCKCGKTFKRARKYSLKQTPRCDDCCYEFTRTKVRAKKYHQLPKYREWQHNRRLEREYGINKEKYEQLLKQQNYVCAICQEKDSRHRLSVDHDHVTGKIRGLLCHRCNRTLGMLKENRELFRSCNSYLMKFDERKTWDEYFLDIAHLVSTRSKDPSTKVGAVIVRDRIILSTGYNGFPSGVNDNIPERYERPEKYLWTIHAEENAILNAVKVGMNTSNSTIYVTPLSPCSNCALAISQAGIKEVVYRKMVNNPRFEESCNLAKEIFSEVGISVRELVNL